MRRINVGLKAGLICALAIAGLMPAGCSDKGTGGTSGNGKVVMIMHDGPVSSMKHVWLTVESAMMIGSSAYVGQGTGPIVLAQPVRMDFLALDSVARILAGANIAAGTYSKIRLQVSNPEFVLANDSVVSASDIQLVANGQVDLNPQSWIVIDNDSTTVVSLDLDLDNSIQVNTTGSGRFILRPQVMVDSDSAASMKSVILEGTVLSVNAAQSTLELQAAGGNSTVSVATSSQTQILAIGGLQVSLGSIQVGSQLSTTGRINVHTGVVTASRIQIAS
ncbi:MAG: DUF4382 domain-containing protein [candidate division Zixibacteria bacterium]|nr:DUF4382 domain-containing protein [candidate division Zixibacteria bacterium]